MMYNIRFVVCFSIPLVGVLSSDINGLQFRQQPLCNHMELDVLKSPNVTNQNGCECRDDDDNTLNTKLCNAVTLETTTMNYNNVNKLHDVQQKQNNQQQYFDAECSLFFGPSVQDDDILTLYAGKSYGPNEPIEDDRISSQISSLLLLPMVGANKKHYSMWHDYVWDSSILSNDKNHSFTNQNEYHVDVFMSGLLSVMTCGEIDLSHSDDTTLLGLQANVRINYKNLTNECFNMKDNNSAAAAAVSCYNNLYLSSIGQITMGDELILDCTENFMENDRASDIKYSLNKQRNVNNTLIEWIKGHSTCYDNIDVAESTIRGIGRGAFTKRNVRIHEVIAVSPVLHFDASQMDIVQQRNLKQMNDTQSKIIELLGNTENDDDDDEEEEDFDTINEDTKWIEYNNTEVLGHQLMINYCFGHAKSNVLLLPIAPGVTFINHASETSNDEENLPKPNAYIRWSNQMSDSEKIRNTLPQLELYELKSLTLAIEYVALRDINVGEEIFIDYGTEWQEAWDRHQTRPPVNDDTKMVTEPFRHKMSVPDTLYPPHWFKYDPTVSVPNFVSNPLRPGEMSNVRWTETNEIVTPWAFRIGLNSTVRERLLEYSNLVGTTKILSHLTKEGNSVRPSTHSNINVNGNEWYVQRPSKEWKSNLHWLSPTSPNVHDEYLQALSLAGFDEVLSSIGNNLQLDGLVAFQLTFIAVSHSTKGFMHTDVRDTGHKAYNVIIPLIIVNDTEPELDIESGDGKHIGRYQYQYDEAILIGDDVRHGTAALDYRSLKGMRLAATIYIADFNEMNVNQVTSYFTQAYPPSDDKLMMSWAGIHWKKDDTTRQLPKPHPDHILLKKQKQNKKITRKKEGGE